MKPARTHSQTPRGPKAGVRPGSKPPSREASSGGAGKPAPPRHAASPLRPENRRRGSDGGAVRRSASIRFEKAPQLNRGFPTGTETAVAPRKPETPCHNLLVVISAPSGAGKTTLCQQLLAARPDMTRAITCTTRAPRVGEKDGVDYYFLDAADFLKRLQAGNFLEHATVYGHSYGILKSEILGKLRAGRDVLLNVDVQGAATIRAKAGEDPELRRALVSVFLTPPSMAVLEGRLRNRKTDADAVIQKRLGVARQEISQWKNFDYLLISRTIPEDFTRMQGIIEAEKMRVARAQAPEF